MSNMSQMSPQNHYPDRKGTRSRTEPSATLPALCSIVILTGLFSFRSTGNIAMWNLLIPQMGHLHCESLVDRSQQIISDEEKGKLHLPEHYIVSGCSIDLANMPLSLKDNLQDDRSLFVPLIPHSMLLESLISPTASSQLSSSQLYGRLRHEVVLNVLSNFSQQDYGGEYVSIPMLPDLDGILLTRNTGLLLPEMISWPSDTLQVAQLDTTSWLKGGYEHTKWSLLITTVAASVIITSMIAGSRLAYIGSPAHRGISLIQALPASTPQNLLVVSFGKASWRRRLISVGRGSLIPFLLAFGAFAAPTVPRAIAEHNPAIILFSIAYAMLAFFSARRITADALCDNGRGVCWVMIIWSAVMILSLLPPALLVLNEGRVLPTYERQSYSHFLVNLLLTAGLFSPFGIYGSYALRLRSCRLEGLEKPINFIPLLRRSPVLSKRVAARTIFIRARLVFYHLLFFVSCLGVGFLPVGGLFLPGWVHDRLGRRRERLRWLLRRYQAPPARLVMERETRPKILLLRSFLDDELELKTDVATDRFTFEEVITGGLWSWGPVIAIGRPGENLPFSGAAREYLGNDVWRTRVAELVGEAQLIVLVVHNTDGLRWELNQIIRAGALNKCLFIVPNASVVEVDEHRAKELRTRWRKLWEDADHEVGCLDLPQKTVAVWVPRSGCKPIVLTANKGFLVDDYDAGMEFGVALIRASASTAGGKNEAGFFGTLFQKVTEGQKEACDSVEERRREPTTPRSRGDA